MATSHWYDTFGRGYNNKRNPDGRIQAAITAALAKATSIANIGAGTGAYEPAGKDLFAVEPSGLMVSEYRGAGLPIRATAEQLPFPDRSVDACLASLTMHHWADWRLGVREMARIARQSVVIFTHDPLMNDFWLFDYFPEIHDMDLEIFEPLPVIAEYADGLGFATEHTPVVVPADCTDGFLGAYWRRPEAYLETGVRAAISSFNKLTDDVVHRGVDSLRADLASGAWDQNYARLRQESELDIGYRLVILTRRSE